MSEGTVGELVKKIQSTTTSDIAVEEYSVDASKWGLSDRWIRAVFSVKAELPVLDLSVDVNGIGKTILTQMNVPEETQTKMWEKWPTLPEDVRASWVEDFKGLDFDDQGDVTTYVQLLVNLLSS